ncbi:MAG: potassium transporter TrkG [Verrucomicrobiales bacterium]|nr:potassium transporter TrkG [Verrucomicrobiales bacterium]
MTSVSPPSVAGRPVLVTGLLSLQAITGLVAFALLVWELGWPISLLETAWFEWTTWGLVVVALIAEAGLAASEQRLSKVKKVVILTALLVLAAGRFGLERPLREWLGDLVAPSTAALLALVVVQLTLIVPVGLRLLRVTRARILQNVRPGTLFVATFALAILGGMLMLKTPNATTGGISWLDALFTSTSAVCVTGLAVVDTEHALTPQGQVILLLLIQVGGLGIMTLTYFMALVVGQGISLRDRARISELFSDDNLGAMGQLIGKVVLITLLIEAAGAMFLHMAWSANPPREGTLLWDAVFHSVSAFCNAGFSNFSAGLADPTVVGNRATQVVIMVLIIAGGIGFAVIIDLPRLILHGGTTMLKKLMPHSRRIARWSLRYRVRLHVRLVLKVTFWLIVLGAAAFFVAEGWTWSTDRAWEAVFNSVTARTAGFNITDFSTYGFAAVVVMCVLMFIGGSPGGTAGGIKTTTFAIALGELWRIVRGHQSLHMHRRRIARDVVERSTATIVLSGIWVTISILLVSWGNPEADPSDVVFECFSAFGTVGLSRAFTMELSPFSKAVIIASMFAGRVGVLTLVFTLAGQAPSRRYELPDARLPLN